MTALKMLETRLSSFRPSPRHSLLIAFVFGVAVRAIPELLSFPHPIGFDTIYYAWRMKEGVVWANWSGVFSSWLLYGILVPLYSLVVADPFLTLKAAMPLLFGLNTCGVYYLATEGFGWSVRKGLFAVGLFSFQIAILGISWHFYRNMLGLGILLFALPWILKDKLSLRSLALFSVLSVLAVFSHESASVLLFTSVLSIVVFRYLRGRSGDAVKVLVAALPALSVFIASVYLMAYPLYRAAPSNVLMVLQKQGHYSGPLFFMTDYLSVVDPVQNYGGYVNLATSVISLFSLLFIAILPLAIVGFFRHEVLDVWVVLLSVGALGCLAMPFFALDLWSRWMLLLVFPLTYYTANGFVRILHPAKTPTQTNCGTRRFRLSPRVAKGLVMVSVVSGFVFMTSPTFAGQGGVFGLPTTVNYLPSTMLSNAVPLSDVDSTVEAFRWVNTAMDGNSCFLAHDALFNWAMFSLDRTHTVVYFKSDVADAIDVATAHGFEKLWLIWWNTDIGWYGFKVPDSFHSVFSSGRISVFEYSGDVPW